MPFSVREGLVSRWIRCKSDRPGQGLFGFCAGINVFLDGFIPTDSSSSRNVTYTFAIMHARGSKIKQAYKIPSLIDARPDPGFHCFVNREGQFRHVR